MELASSTIPIQQAAELSGLPSSTLRYYEEIGLIGPIERTTSGHRRYQDADVELAVAIACLRATGLSVREIRTYLANRERGEGAASDQLALLVEQQRRLTREADFLRIRREYLDAKVAYWRAVAASNQVEQTSLRTVVAALAERLHPAPKPSHQHSSEKNE